MSSGTGNHDRDYPELVFLHALRALPASEIPVLEAHLSMCPDCRQEMETLRPIIGAFVSWPTDVLRPTESVWDRLARRIAAETGQAPVLLPPLPPSEPDWEEAAPGLPRKTVSACWYDSPREPTIRLTAMLESRSCTYSTASCGSTTRNSIPGVTTGRRPALAISVSGARLAARVFCSPPRETCFARHGQEKSPSPHPKDAPEWPFTI